MKLASSIRLAILFVLLAGIFGARVGHAAPLAATITVAPGQSIQQAIDSAAAGDTVQLDDGVYHQQVTITKPLTLRAKNGGKATISGADANGPVFAKVAGTTDLYAAAVPWTVSWVMQGDRSLLNYRGLNSLREFKFPAGERLSAPYPGPREGFAYVNGTLYVRLANSRDPANTPVAINRNEIGDGITIDANDVTVSGLRIVHWSNNGITVKPTVQRTTIRDCFFTGMYRGIEAYSSKVRQGLVVEYNEFSGKPVYEIRRSDPNKKMWEALYDSNLSVRFLRARMHGITVRHNYIYEAFDGIEAKGIDANPTAVESDISYNVIQNVVDNSLEFDTTEKYMRMRVHHNLLVDGYSYLSMAPFQAGELMVDHNLFYTSPERGLDKTVWLKTCMITAANPAVPLRGMTVVHNTVVLGDSSAQKSNVYTNCNAESLTYQDSRIENNLVAVQSSRQWLLNGFTLSRHNLVHGSNVRVEHMPNVLIAKPNLVSTSPRIDFRLGANSPAINQGINKDGSYYHTSTGAGTDLGALEHGESWNFPRPGPRWAGAANMSQRPGFPASLDPSWAGFGAQLLSAEPTQTHLPLPGIVCFKPPERQGA